MQKFNFKITTVKDKHLFTILIPVATNFRVVTVLSFLQCLAKFVFKND